MGSCFFFFFFQAEDGIRDLTVTGVQTCALPIWPGSTARGPIAIIRPGDRIFFEPGEDHWHGAAPTRFMTHLAMLEVDDKGNKAMWGDHVTDAEYAAAPAIDEA